jgi:hypothetical protein
MRGWFERRDAALLRLFTTAAHAWQRATGKTSYWITGITSGAFALAAIINALDYWFPAILPTNTSLALMVVCCIAALGLVLVSADFFEADEEFRADPTVLPEVSDSYRGTFDAYVRVLGVWWLPLVLFACVVKFLDGRYFDALVSVCSFPMMVATMGFGAVTPLPPCAGKFSEWVGSLRASFGASVHESA